MSNFRILYIYPLKLTNPDQILFIKQHHRNITFGHKKVQKYFSTGIGNLFLTKTAQESQKLEFIFSKFVMYSSFNLNLNIYLSYSMKCNEIRFVL